MNYDEQTGLWPEDPMPEYAAGCNRCELCAQRTRMVWGEGNPNAKLIVILDNPGSREDREGLPFVCGARQMLQQGARAAGLGAGDIYVTYILKCRPRRKYDKDASRAECLIYLERQMEQGDFKAAFCLGDTAVKSFFHDEKSCAKEARGRWHEIRGTPAYASYHPLAVRRRPNLLTRFMEDWQAVGSFIKAGKEPNH